MALREFSSVKVGDVFVVSSTETSGRMVATARSSLRSQVSASSAGYLRSSGAGIAAVALGWLALAAALASDDLRVPDEDTVLNVVAALAPG